MLALAAAAGAGVYPPPFATTAWTAADAALVLSGDVDYVRIRAAAALQTSGRVAVLVVTGEGIGGDSAAELAEQARRLGVPASAVLREDRSRTTRENLLNVAPLVRDRGWHRIALVTSVSHMGRAVRAARRVMPDVEWLAVPVADAGPAARVGRSRAGEWLKLGWYGLRGWI
jgi:uncharacterized SAM-binding protein YcdF (DUF218 family)